MLWGRGQRKEKSRFIMTISNWTSVMKPSILPLILTAAGSKFPVGGGMRSKLSTSVFCLCPGCQFQVWRALSTQRRCCLEHGLCQDANLHHPEGVRYRQTKNRHHPSSDRPGQSEAGGFGAWIVFSYFFLYFCLH